MSRGRRVGGFKALGRGIRDHGARRGQSNPAGVGAGVSPPSDSLGCMVGGRAWSTEAVGAGKEGAAGGGSR